MCKTRAATGVIMLRLRPNGPAPAIGIITIIIIISHAPTAKIVPRNQYAPGR